MDLKDPIALYTAESNIESHVIVAMLNSHGIAAMAVEDQSGVSLWEFGRLTQFHKPKVWVDKCDELAAAELILDFEQRKQKRDTQYVKNADIIATCEDCGKATPFSSELNGTTQECDWCGSYLDVGEFAWGDDDVAEGEFS